MRRCDRALLFNSFFYAVTIVAAVVIVAIVCRALLPLKPSKNSLGVIYVHGLRRGGLEGGGRIRFLTAGTRRRSGLRRGILRYREMGQFYAKLSESRWRALKHIPVGGRPPKINTFLAVPRIGQHLPGNYAVNSVGHFGPNCGASRNSERIIELIWDGRRKCISSAADENQTGWSFAGIRPVQLDFLFGPEGHSVSKNLRTYGWSREIQKSPFGISLDFARAVRYPIFQVSEYGQNSSENSSPNGCGSWSEHPFPPWVRHLMVLALFAIEIPTFILFVGCLRWLILFDGKWKALLGAFLSAAICGVSVWGIGSILQVHI